MMTALLATTPLSYVQQSDSVIASIFEAKGRIAIKTKTSRHWEYNPKNWLLCEGDSVKAEKLGSATIVYRNKEVSLHSQERHHVTRVIKKSGSSKIERILSWLFAQEKPLEHGANRGAEKPPVLIYPRYGKLLSNQPSFTWLSSAAGTKYQLQLFNNNDSLIWQTTLKDTVANYPITAPKLARGISYQAEIKRQYKDSAEDYGNFVIASAEENASMAALQKDIQNTFKTSGPNDVTADLVYAAALMKEEFFTDALLVLQSALKKQPNNQKIRTMLAQIYDQVGPPVLITPMLK